MKIGDIFYFVDVTLGKITKSKIINIKPNEGFPKGDYDTILFSHTNACVFKNDIHLNPTEATYFYSHIKFRKWNSEKTYLIFTEVEEAQKALVEYVLPRIMDLQQIQADEIIKQYQKLIDKVQKTEVEIKNNTENFDKKCNALKKKFV